MFKKGPEELEDDKHSGLPMTWETCGIIQEITEWNIRNDLRIVAGIVNTNKEK